MNARTYLLALGLCAVALSVHGCAGSPRAEPASPAGAAWTGAVEFEAPMSVCVDARSQIYIHDRDLCRVFKMDNISGAGLVAFGQSGYAGPGSFRVSEGRMALDSQGRIYLAVTRASKIVRFDDLKGKGWTELDTGALGFPSPQGVTVDGGGRIYFTDGYLGLIARVDSMEGDGLLTFGAKGSGEGQFQAPSSLGLDAQGRIYVVDTANHRVCRFDDMEGSNWKSWDGKDELGRGGFQGPTSIALASNGSIYVTDPTRGRVFRFADLSGAGREVWGWDGLGARTLMPNGICLDGEGRILFTDRQGKRIVRMDDMSGKGLVSYPPSGD